jgi:ABC-2 type transport system permease protein
MNIHAFLALVRRDLRLFFLDKRAMTMSFVAPIVIASFFGYLFGGVSNDREQAKIAVAAVDGDGSAVSKRVIAALAGERLLAVKPATLDEARAAVRAGKTTVAAVIPAGFGERAVRGFFRNAAKPEIELLYDPSHATELAMVRGVLAQHVMESVSAEATSGNYVEQSLHDAESATGLNATDRQSLLVLLQGVRAFQQRSASSTPAAGSGFNMPYSVREEAVTARKGVTYNSMAHSFAGMSVQFVLFMGIDAGMIVLTQRRSGMWKRLQAAPVSRFLVIGSRAASATLIATIILAVVFLFARVAFGVKIEGSFAGFGGVCVAFSLMTATFGLLVAVLGKTPEGTRGIAILVTLVLVMLGGSWVPTFIFPQWLQRLTVAVPTRWAVDGLDGMVWRGLGFTAALTPIAVLLGFAALFSLIAVWRFRWETEG